MVADAWRFSIGAAVSFPGIGCGIIVDRELWQDRPFYRVLFKNAAVPHLCGQSEICLSRMGDVQRGLLQARAAKFCRSFARVG